MAKEYYVDNKEFLKLMKNYHEQKKTNDDAEVPEQAIVNIMNICYRLANSPNFANYTYKNEMINDAIENCFRYIDNFDPNMSENPFGYFTQIAYFAFVRRIEIEKKQFKIKGKVAYYLGVSEDKVNDVQEHDEEEEFDNSYVEWLQKYYIDYEAQKKTNEKKNTYKKEKEKSQDESPSPLENFME